MTCLASTHKIIAGSTCVCSVGYYELDGVCELCDPSCFECNGPSAEECLSCASPLTLNSLFTSCVCPGSSYLTVSAGVYSCSPCTISNCTSCFSATVCLNCSGNMVLSSNAASCECAEGFRFNSTSNSCEACQVPFCKQCLSDVATCSICYAGSITTSCSCSPSSSSSSAADFDSRGDSCTLCHYSCLTCDGFEYNNCLSCSTDRNYNSSL